MLLAIPDNVENMAKSSPPASFHFIDEVVDVCAFSYVLVCHMRLPMYCHDSSETFKTSQLALNILTDSSCFWWVQ